MRRFVSLLPGLVLLGSAAAHAEGAPAVFSEADHLRGSYGPFRANNDLLYYHLDVRVDPDRQYLSGKNSIRFKMLKDGRRIQLDLVPAFRIDKIVLDRAHAAPLPLQFERAAGRTVYIDFPNTLLKGGVYTIEFYYSGHPVEMGRFGGFVFRKDPMYQTIMTTDMLAFFNRYTGRQLRPIFDQYLRHAQIPTLELRFDAAAGSVAYRWIAEEKGFAMPVRVGRKDQWQIIHPTTSWQSMHTDIGKDDFGAATDFYYINVSKQQGNPWESQTPVRP